MRFTGTPPNFWLAFLAAPLMGALASMLFAVIITLTTAAPGARPSLTELAMMSAAVGVYALAICAAFTLLLGASVVAYVCRRGRVPSLGAAIGIGVAAALIVFAGFPSIDAIRQSSPLDSGTVFFAAFAAAAAIPTAWSFWWLGLRGRHAAAA
jgi:hypothetical protein